MDARCVRVRVRTDGARDGWWGTQGGARRARARARARRERDEAGEENVGGKVVERAVAAVVVATTMHGACVDGASADAYADYLNSMSEEGTAVVTLSGEVDAEQALKDREAARAIGTERP